jgi:hypothetical protein
MVLPHPSAKTAYSLGSNFGRKANVGNLMEFLCQSRNSKGLLQISCAIEGMSLCPKAILGRSGDSLAEGRGRDAPSNRLFVSHAAFLAPIAP